MQNLVTLAPHLLVAVNTILILALFLGINQRVRKLRKRLAACEAWEATGLARVSNTVNELAGRIANVEKDVSGLKSAVPGAATLNGALRAKMLKMYRLGQPAEQIAEALRVPRGEVDLLVKVHGIVMRAYQSATPSESDVETLKKG